MGEPRPDPKLGPGGWTVDLRRLGFGQRYKVAGLHVPREEALHLAYRLLEQLRGRRLAEPAQRDLFGEAVPQSFAAVVDAWRAEHRPSGDGARRYVATYARLVRAELGDYRLADFAPPEGTRRLAAYVKELECRELSGRTIRNRVSVAEQALRLAVARGWIAHEPLHPSLPPKAPPVFSWITEPMFRALRAEVHRTATRNQLQRAIPRAASTLDFALYLERRRLYLSWLFYTGVHHHDADAATADWLFLDGRSYIRHNNKSAAHVPDEQFEMPEPLHDDLTALVRLQGRPFYPGESFTGGPWSNAARVMQKAARALRFPDGCNPSILRRSFVRELALRGYTEQECADRMGHADLTMIHTIYMRTPRPAGRVETRWKSAGTGAPPPNAGMARVLQIKGE